MEILGEKEVQQLFAMAPKTFSAAMRRWMYRERRSFVGNKKKDGVIRRDLQRKPHRYEQRNWKPYVADAFTGVLENKNSLANMTLRMGVISNRLEKMPYLQALAEGATIRPKNAQWLIVPHYGNLASAGLFGRYGGRGKRTYAKLFGEMFNKSNIHGVIHGGKLLVYGDFPTSGGSHNARHSHLLHHKLLFIGLKKVSIKKRIKFYERFNSRIPSITKRANNAIKQTIRGIERGRIETK